MKRSRQNPSRRSNPSLRIRSQAPKTSDRRSLAAIRSSPWGDSFHHERILHSIGIPASNRFITAANRGRCHPACLLRHAIPPTRHARPIWWEKQACRRAGRSTGAHANRGRAPAVGRTFPGSTGSRTGSSTPSIARPDCERSTLAPAHRLSPVRAVTPTVPSLATPGSDHTPVSIDLSALASAFPSRKSTAPRFNRRSILGPSSMPNTPDC